MLPFIVYFIIWMKVIKAWLKHTFEYGFMGFFYGQFHWVNAN